MKTFSRNEIADHILRHSTAYIRQKITEGQSIKQSPMDAPSKATEIASNQPTHPLTSTLEAARTLSEICSDVGVSEYRHKK